MPNGKTMSAVFWILLFLLSLVLVALLTGALMEYFMDYRGCIAKRGPKLKLKSFLLFYEINPTRWSTFEWWVECKMPSDTSYSSLFFDTQSFHFSYIDTCRYHLWYKNLQKRKTVQSQDKATLRMLEAVKQDIADFETKNQAHINNAIKEITSCSK